MDINLFTTALLLILLLLLFTILTLYPNRIRQKLVSTPLLSWVRQQLPHLSPTEQEALNSGSVDWDGELFTGKPNWHQLLNVEAHQLSDEEQTFINGPVNDFCMILDDWNITSETFDLPEEAWQSLK